MATYQQLFDIASGKTASNLTVQITVAVAIAADAIRQEADTTTNHAARLAWAKQAYADPQSVANQIIWAILAENSAATVAAITGATDATVQTAVNNVINVLTGG